MGCVSSPDSAFERLDLEAPDEFLSANEDSRAEVDGWLRDFGDSQLEALVEEALEGNPNLTAAAHRVRASRAAARAGASGLWPRITGGYRAAAVRFGFPLRASSPYPIDAVSHAKR